MLDWGVVLQDCKVFVPMAELANGVFFGRELTFEADSADGPRPPATTTTLRSLSAATGCTRRLLLHRSESGKLLFEKLLQNAYADYRGRTSAGAGLEVLAEQLRERQDADLLYELAVALLHRRPVAVTPPSPFRSSSPPNAPAAAVSDVVEENAVEKEGKDKSKEGEQEEETKKAPEPQAAKNEAEEEEEEEKGDCC